MSNKGEISDGYHTFNELYEHRTMLFLLAASQFTDTWISKKHDDGTMFPGYFIAGINLPYGKTITYHLENKYWDAAINCYMVELPQAPKWDGHTSQDVLERIKDFFAR